jgi:hypothetical protein
MIRSIELKISNNNLDYKLWFHGYIKKLDRFHRFFSMKTPCSEDITLRFYIIACVLTVGLVMVVWLLPFHNYYGWQADDWAGFRKAIRVVEDWRDAFTMRANILQPYFFIFTWLPLKLGWSLPSINFPVYGPDTGKFRLLAMLTVLWHGIFLLTWAWFAQLLINNRLIAFLSLVFIATSPSFCLWVPQTETRYIGLPFALIAAGIVLNEMRKDHFSLKWFIFAGFLFTLSQALHYTSLYFVVPFLLTVFLISLLSKKNSSAQERDWLFNLIKLRRKNIHIPQELTRHIRAQISPWLAMLIGIISLPLMLEFVSWGMVGLPFDQGPFMTTLRFSSSEHAAQSADIAMKINILKEYIIYTWRLISWPMLLMFLYGLIAMIATKNSEKLVPVWIKVVIVGVLILGVRFCFATDYWPFFRKTVPLQPFVFLVASYGIIDISAKLSQACFKGSVITYNSIIAVFVILISLIPLSYSKEVHAAHFDMGHLINLSQQLHGEGDVKWLTPRIAHYTFEELVKESRPDDLLITEFPYEFFSHQPASIYPLLDVKPIATAKRLWSTYTLHAEHGFWIGFDLQYQPVMNDARLYRARDLKYWYSARKEIKVKKVIDSDTFNAALQGQNIIDHDSMGDGTSHWRSMPFFGPHYVELQFSEAIEIDNVRAFGELYSLHAINIDELAIFTAERPEQPLKMVWHKGSLSKSSIVDAHFDKRKVQVMRFVILKSSRYAYGVSPTSIIGEIDIPGYNLTPFDFHDAGEAPAILTAEFFANLPYDYRKYRDLSYNVDPVQTDRILLTLREQSRVTSEIIYLNNKPLPTRWDNYSAGLVAILPFEYQGPAGHKLLCSWGSLSVGGKLRQRMTKPIPASDTAVCDTSKPHSLSIEPPNPYKLIEKQREASAAKAHP